MLRCHVVAAVFKRNLLSYFTGVLGYLFTVVFVVAGAYLAFDAQFFTNNPDKYCADDPQVNVRRTQDANGNYVWEPYIN